VGPGAGAGAGAAQAISAAASITEAITANNLFIKTSCLPCSLNKTQIGVKSYFLGKTPELAVTYLDGQPISGITNITRTDLQFLSNLESNGAVQFAIH
jgi:hypothetical protein